MTQLNPVPSRDSVLGTDKSTENVIFEQIREHDRVFRDVRPPPHQVRRVVFDNELSAVGDLTRRITVLLTTANPACPEYRWRIPHKPNKPPFAISVATSPCPLPYRLETVNDEVDVAHTEIVIDLSSCRPNTTHEFSFRYSQTAVVLAVRRRPFFTQWTWVWSYTFLSQSQYFDLCARFPDRAKVLIESGGSTAGTTARERITEMDGRAVYSYAYWAPRQGERISGRLTYRVWSPATISTIAVGASVLVAIPAAFASTITLGLVTLLLALVATGITHWLCRRLS
jgi:hypothetical protein